MKYKVLLKTLRALMYVKRFFWWAGAGALFVLGKGAQPVWRFLAYIKYKAAHLSKRSNRVMQSREWWFKRDFLQIILFLVLGIIALPQTKVLAKKDPALSGQETIAYHLIGGDQDYDVQEIVAEVNSTVPSIPAWRQGALAPGQTMVVVGGDAAPESDLLAIVAGGSALLKPTLMPTGASPVTRNEMVLYEVRAGDSLGMIAVDFGLSVETILWENGLTLRTLIRPGDVLKIPPTSGVMYTVQKRDTIKKIALFFGAKSEEILAFNGLKANGTDLVIGKRIMIPGGVKPVVRVAVRAPKITPTISRRAAPPSSLANPSASGFVWPTGAHNITQYFSWKHHAIDVGGPWQTPTYAAKAGVVEKAQCGWNSGYGCLIIIDHGDGVRTLYAHHSQLLVSPGDEVEAGQTIGLMGNTGHVRGVTGIHLHFEIIINGVRKNPLGYVR